MHVNVYYRNVEYVRCFFQDLWQAIRKYYHEKSRILELTSKVTTEFAYNGTSRRLHKERYCGSEVLSELKCM